MIGRTADPILWDEGMALYQAASGTRDELLGAAIIVCLGTEVFVPLALRACGACMGIARDVGERLLWHLREHGVRPVGLVGAAAAILRPAPAATPAAAPAEPTTPAAVMLRPVPGLTRRGEDWRTVHGRTIALVSAAAETERAEWSAAMHAHAEGRLAEWMDAVGRGLGFALESAPGEG